MEKSFIISEPGFRLVSAFERTEAYAPSAGKLSALFVFLVCFFYYLINNYLTNIKYYLTNNAFLICIH